MKTPIEKLSVDINVSEKNSQTFVTLTSLDVPKRRDSFFEIKLNNSSSVIRIQKNLKKHVDLRKIKVYITQASLDFTNPLHVSWAIFITVFKIENESKLTIKDIRMNIDKPMIAYYLLKNSNLEQIQSKITFTNKSYLPKQINRDILTNESFEKYLPSVISGGKAPQKKQALVEAKEITGNKVSNSNRSSEEESNIIDIRRLAGLKI